MNESHNFKTISVYDVFLRESDEKWLREVLESWEK